MINEEHFDKDMYLAFNECTTALLNGDLLKSQSIAKNTINSCKDIIKQKDSLYMPDTKNKALIIGILFRGLQNLIDLLEVEKTENWLNVPELVEKAWISLCDCVERVQYVSKYINLSELIRISDEIMRFQTIFREKYGNGIFMSSEAIIKKAECSICGQDIRSCEHISGSLYSGVRCIGIVKEIKPIGASIVDSPKDFRCRIWPWNLKESDENELSFTGILLTSFSLDDFMDDTKIS